MVKLKKYGKPLVAFRVDPEEKDLLISMAREDGKTMSEELRCLIVREYVLREINRKNGYPPDSIFTVKP